MNHLLLLFCLLPLGVSLAQSPSPTRPMLCPWSRDAALASRLDAHCVCSAGQEQTLSVQCHGANFTALVSALQRHATEHVIELLYVNGSVVGVLPDFVFKNLKVISLQISGGEMTAIANNAFRGLENTLQNVNLAGNELRSVPVQPLRQLRMVSLLDLSHNKIKFVPENAFVTLRLKTLKLSDNNLTLSEHALRGLETSLKNLNLKGCQLKGVPEAVQKMTGLAFLDLAQNNIRTVPAGVFKALDSLTALNLERNIIQSLDGGVFEGVSDTLSSLSLLNNLLTDFPVEAVMTLKELRVLDLGFNLLRVLPEQSFRGSPQLTLLALDGNPMASLPEEAFVHLNSSLRGLSLGGRFLTCDCKMRWLADWIAAYDLQVTSRERSPQFCGNPQHLRDRSFYQLSPQDLICGEPPTEPPPPTTTTTTTTPTTPRPTTTSPSIVIPPEVVVTSRVPGLSDDEAPVPTGLFRPPQRSGSARPAEVITSQQEGGRVKPGDIITEIKMTVGQDSNSQSSRKSPSLFLTPPTAVTSAAPVQQQKQRPVVASQPTPPQFVRPPPPAPLPQPEEDLEEVVSRPRELPQRPRPTENTGTAAGLNPGLLMRPTTAAPSPPVDRRAEATPVRTPAFDTDTNFGSAARRPSLQPEADVSNRVSAAVASPLVEVMVRDAYKEDNSIVIKWESETSNILGFRVVYRLFGKSEFKQGPPLAPSEREFRIKNVPPNECIVVCIVSMEDQQITPSSVPFEQCREIRTEGVGASQKLDWIIIPASAAIVATVIIAVIIFIACIKSNRKSKVSKLLDEKPIHTLSMNGMGTLGMGGGAPLAGLAPLGLTGHKEFDNMSVYSQRTERSVPRARMYHMERPGQDFRGSINGGYIPEDARSHISAMSSRTARSKSRSIGDLTGKGYLAGSNFGLGLSRQDLRQSRQSLVSHHGLNTTELMMLSAASASATGRQSRASGVSRASRKSAALRHATSLSRSRERLNPGYISSQNDDNDDSLNEEDSEDNWAGTSTATDNNWTDYDQDIYMHRNTTKFGGGHARGLFRNRDDVNL